MIVVRLFCLLLSGILFIFSVLGFVILIAALYLLSAAIPIVIALGIAKLCGII